jgi:hypothetical protein
MDSRRINEEYKEIMRELILVRPELEDLKGGDVTIICLSSGHEKKKGDKKVLGQTEKISEKYKWGIPCDFTITIFEPNIEGFTEDQVKILILHELLHIGVDAERLFIKPHDLEDFKAIIDEFGTDWAAV